MIKSYFLLIFVLSAASCINPTPYQNKSTKTHDGFIVKKISAVKYQITFHGNEETSRERANDFALLRAAQETKAGGYEFFSILRSKSITTSERYNLSNDNFKPIKFTNKDGTVTLTKNYNTHYGSYKKKYAITRPDVFIIIEFLEDNYDQDLEILNADEIIKNLSKKYNLDL